MRYNICNPLLRRLVDYVKATKSFGGTRKNVELKILAAILYFFGFSLREKQAIIYLYLKK